MPEPRVGSTRHCRTGQLIVAEVEHDFRLQAPDVTHQLAQTTVTVGVIQQNDLSHPQRAGCGDQRGVNSGSDKGDVRAVHDVLRNDRVRCE